VLSPVTLAILTATFREAAARSHALAVWTAVGVGGGAVGGLLGGVLTELLSWRAIFFVNVPLGVLVASAAVAVIPRDRLRFRRDLDLLGALTVTGGLVALSWGFIASNDYGWRSWQVGGALAGGVALMTAFVGIEWRLARFPLVPLSVFRSRSLAVGNGLGFLSFFAVFATWFFLTLYLQRVRGYSAIETGLIFLPLTMAVIAASQVGFRLVGRMNAALLTALASAISVAGLAWLGQLAPDTKLVWVVVPAVVTMIGGGLIFAPITVAATARVPPEQSGLASGILNTTRQVGGALGLAVLATAATTETGRHVAEGQAAALTAGFGLAFTVGAAVFMFGGFLGLVALPRRLPTEPAAANEEAMPWTLRGGRG
jgi:MFS family permease